MNHGLVLQVVVPLATAPLCVLVRSGRAAGWLAALVALFLLGNALWLFGEVRAAGPMAYALGGVPPPLGIEYRLDLLNALVLVVVAAVTALATWWAALASPRELPGTRLELFFAAWLLCVTGSMGLLLTADAFHVFVFLEVASLATYVLVAHGPHRSALVASFRYLLSGTVAATFILIGIGLLYAMTGTLNLHDLAERLPAVADTRTVQAGWAFLGVGLCLKAAVFPLHLWLPGAYASAPSAVSALLAGIATKIAVYLWLRLFFATFARAVPVADMPVDDVLLLAGLCGALVGSTVAVFQDEPRRLLAWSSIAQVGYMVTGLGLGSRAGLHAALAHIVNHALLKSAAFLVLGTIALRLGTGARTLRVADLAGLARRMPGLALMLLVVGLGLVGMPLTAGFLGKWLLVEALLERELWAAAAAVLVSSLLAVVYVWRLVEPMYAAAPAAPAEAAGPALGPALRWGLMLPALLLCAAAVVLGVETGFSVGVTGDAVDQLLGGGR